jgi:hypothetical protein
MDANISQLLCSSGAEAPAGSGPSSYEPHDDRARDTGSLSANERTSAALRDSLIPSEEDQWDTAFDQQLSTWEPDEGTDAESVSRYSAREGSLRGSERARHDTYPPIGTA